MTTSISSKELKNMNEKTNKVSFAALPTYQLNHAHWYKESSQKFQLTILDRSRQHHVSPNIFEKDKHTEVLN